MTNLPLKLSRRAMLLSLAVAPLGAQQVPTEGNAGAPFTPPAPGGPLDYYCPMDRDVRSDKPGVCPRCGMKLAFGIQEEIEYPIQVTYDPPVFKAGEKVRITFRIADPISSKAVKHYEIVHEKLFHMFVVSQDLQYFLHDHPVPQPDGSFVFEQTFPKPGMYRILADFYPSGGTPQLIPRTVVVPGEPGQEIPLALPHPKPELGVSHCTNLDVELTMDPPTPIVGLKTLLFFKLSPPEGIEKYIGAWAHMLAASDDLIDLIHDHPFIADGGPQMQFNIIFPRAHTYKIWVQFQRKGVVNTSAFTIPVSELK
jgi:heavy metal-binding protein